MNEVPERASGMSPAQCLVLELIKKGKENREARAQAGVSAETWQGWISQDQTFRAAYRALRPRKISARSPRALRGNSKRGKCQTCSGHGGIVRHGRMQNCPNCGGSGNAQTVS